MQSRLVCCVFRQVGTSLLAESILLSNSKFNWLSRSLFLSRWTGTSIFRSVGTHCYISLQKGQEWVKIFVSQGGIEPQSLAFWASIITTRPPRHHYIHPSKQEASPHTSWRSYWPPMSQWVKILVPQGGNKSGLSHSRRAS